MPATMKIEVVQWAFILFVGVAASTQAYGDELLRIVVTIVSMSLGTVVSFFIKKWLNDWKNRKQ